MSEKSIPLSQVNPAMLAKNRRPRRITPLWIYLDLENDVFVAEYPEAVQLEDRNDGKGLVPVATSGIRVTSPESGDVAAQLATHLLHCIWQGCLKAKIPVPWADLKGRKPPLDTDVRQIACAY